MLRILLLALLAIPAPVMAGNIGFLPGDSFFHSILTKDKSQELLKEETSMLKYVQPRWVEGYFCGYHGYWQLQLPSDSKPLILNLQTVYDSVRESSPRKLVEYKSLEGVQVHETNGLHLFVYNADFDPTKYTVGRRYNETWVEDEMAFGRSRRETELQVFDRSPETYAGEWRDASQVPCLKTTYPTWEKHIDAIQRGKGIATCQGPIQIIVLESEEIPSFKSPEDWETFYAVNNTGIKRHRYYGEKKKEWAVVDWTPGMPEPEEPLEMEDVETKEEK